MRLTASLRAWGTPDFATTLKHELAKHAAALPLQQALTTTSAVSGEAIEVIFLNATADGNCIHAKVGIFFSGIVAGCNCADDPTPVEPQTEYCELRLEISLLTAETVLQLSD